MYIFAQDDIPKTTGFSGFVSTGPGVFIVKSNRLAAGPPLLNDVGERQLTSVFNVAPTNTTAAWPLAGEVNYTFSESRTQLFFGNRLEDLLRLDVPFGLGIRQELKDSSIVALSALFTPLELKFWKDPYVEGEDRTKNRLNFPGLRFRWGRMFKTGLEFTTTVRWYRYDAENSGDWLVSQGRLAPEERSLLVRDGTYARIDMLYRFQWKKHRLEPRLGYVVSDREGAAISNKGPNAKLTYLFFTKHFLLDANVLYSRRSSDETNPIYDKTYASDRFGAAVAVFVPIKLFKGKGWSFWVRGEVLNENANIDFYSSRLVAFMGGLLWRHKRP